MNLWNHMLRLPGGRYIEVFRNSRDVERGVRRRYGDGRLICSNEFGGKRLVTLVIGWGVRVSVMYR